MKMHKSIQQKILENANQTLQLLVLLASKYSINKETIKHVTH